MSSAKPTRRSSKKRDESTINSFLGSPWFFPTCGLIAVAIGGFRILRSNSWHLTPAVSILFLGWIAVVLTAWFLWQAAWSAVSKPTEESERSQADGSQRAELLREKKALLKAIKEIEFDLEMGKMSNTDATEITRLYRSRAIEIMKLLDDRGGQTASSSLRAEIDREVEARLALGGAVKEQQ